MGQTVTLAVPEIVDSATTGTETFVNLLISNSAVATLLTVLGGLLIAACVALLIWRKVSPQSDFMQQLNARGNHTVMWTVMFIILGVILIAPAQVLPFVVQILATCVQVVLNILGSIFGF